MKKDIYHRYAGVEEAPYVYAHISRRLKKQRKEQQKYRENIIRQSSSHRQIAGCHPKERRGASKGKLARASQKSVSFKEVSRHEEARDDSPTQQRREATTEKREERPFALPDIQQVSPALESCIRKALIAVNLMDDESEDECHSFDGDDITSFSQDTTLPADNLSKEATGSLGASMVHKTIIIPPGQMGVVIVDSQRGPLITAVSKNCPVDLIVGDTIDSVDGRDCRAALSANQVLQILLARSNQHRFLMIRRIEN